MSMVSVLVHPGIVGIHDRHQSWNRRLDLRNGSPHVGHSCAIAVVARGERYTRMLGMT